MRFVPLVPSDFDPGPWKAFHAVELAWRGTLHGDWPRSGIPVHAVHLGEAPWTAALGETVMDILRARLEPDFLVIPASAPESRMEGSAFLAVLEGILEITHGTGVKVALRPAPGAAPALTRQLKEARGEAVGFCWDAAVAGDLDCISDRLFCAVAAPGEDLAGLQALGYRWNVAVPGASQALLRELEEAHPMVYFPAAVPAVAPDPSVTFGRHLERP